MNKDKVISTLLCPLCRQESLEFIEIVEPEGMIDDNEYIKSSHWCNSCSILTYIIQFKED